MSDDNYEKANAAADATLRHARDLPPGQERSDAIKEAGRLRRVADRLQNSEPLQHPDGLHMAKMRVSSTDLSWMIFERLRAESGSQRPLSVAVVSDRELGGELSSTPEAAPRVSFESSAR
jgi:hypothetical protein